MIIDGKKSIKLKTNENIENKTYKMTDIEQMEKTKLNLVYNRLDKELNELIKNPTNITENEKVGLLSDDLNVAYKLVAVNEIKETIEYDLECYSDKELNHLISFNDNILATCYEYYTDSIANTLEEAVEEGVRNGMSEILELEEQKTVAKSEEDWGEEP